MQTRFEHYAATSMLGSPDSPPRNNGTLKFDRDWEGRAFGIALALSKDGLFEWDDFRRELMNAIAEWEAEHELDDPDWDYYQQWLLALERLILKSSIFEGNVLEAMTKEFVGSISVCNSKLA